MICSTEQRLFERFAIRFPAKFHSSHNGFGSEVFLRDACAQGMRLTSRRRLYRHDTVSIDVDLSDGRDPLMLSGRVIWVQPQSHGLWEIGVELHRIRFMHLHRMFRLLPAGQAG